MEKSKFQGFICPANYVRSRFFVLGFIFLFFVIPIILVITTPATISIETILSMIVCFLVVEFLCLKDDLFAFLKYYITQHSVIIKFGKIRIKEIPLQNAQARVISLNIKTYAHYSKVIVSKDRYILIATPEFKFKMRFMHAEMELKDFLKMSDVIAIPYEARFALYNTYKENFGCDKDDKTFAALEKIVKSDG